MGIGARIGDLRRARSFSQEYVAEKLNISRQAVSKWEQEQANPDMGNLIKLAELFDVSVEYLTTGKTDTLDFVSQPQKQKYNLKKQHVKYIAAAVVLCLIVGVVIRIYTLPVNWDAGACGGGYETHIFNKYSEELVQQYLYGSDDRDNIVSIKAVHGTQEAEWEGRTICLHFDIQYDRSNGGTITERLTYIGHRYWFDTFKWDGAIIEG